ncbi:MAG: Nif11-like leader peptide family natural product precursor, partial [Lachnospiraceae bacterium]|nr:Nif11-like leader peptide family natural product precursor [Lachnospiraceae bacterium]
VEGFMEEMEKHKELREKLVRIGKEYQGDPNDLNQIIRKNILPVAKELGYDFTEEEYRDCASERLKNRKLSETELDQVVGGVRDVNMDRSKTDGNVTIVDKSVTYNVYLIFPGASTNVLK